MQSFSDIVKSSFLTVLSLIYDVFLKKSFVSCRFSSHPTERILECGFHEPGTVDCHLSQQIEQALFFLHDHRYDPFEIYDEEYREDLQGIPDPKLDPLVIMNEFLDILRTLGL